MSVVVTDETAAGACGISATRAMEAKKRQRLADPTLQEVDEESAVTESYCTKFKCVRKYLIIRWIVVEANESRTIHRVEGPIPFSKNGKLWDIRRVNDST
jgi:hypothetical protein